MKLYLAPMEGITGYIYRNALHHVFGDVYDRCFSPFLSPRPRVGLQSKDRRDILPENNPGICLIPQLLSRDAEDVLSLAKELHSLYGYEEFNINCGCPSKTVVSHGRGAGMLKDPEELDRFLDGIFSGSTLRFSVKSRMGISDPEEFDALLAVYEKYPLTELIVHARVLDDYYRLPARKEAFLRSVKNTCLPIIYNGDIFSPEDLQELSLTAGCTGAAEDPLRPTTTGIMPDRGRNKGPQFPAIRGIMLGRGAITDPSLGRRLREDPSRHASPSEFRAFHDIIYSSYQEIFDGPTPLLFHMKELWSYMGALFPDKQKALKRLRKAGDTATYLSSVNEILQ